MAESGIQMPWERKLHEAAANVEDELRRVINYINDEVVPEVRQNGSVALRAAAAELERLAGRMDHRSAPPSTRGGSPKS